MEFEERRKGRKLQRHERRVDDKFANSNLAIYKIQEGGYQNVQYVALVYISCQFH